MGSEDRGVNPSVLKIVDEKLNYLCLELLIFKCIRCLWCFIWRITKTKLTLLKEILDKKKNELRLG
jgi:hypothetical protein